MVIFNPLSPDSFTASKELFQAVLDASSDLMSVNRVEDGLCVAVNSVWLNVLSFERDEVIGKTAEELAVWTKPGLRSSIVERLRADGVIESMDAVLRGKDGRLHDCLASMRILNIEGEDLLLFSAQEMRSDHRIEQVARTSRALLIDALESINEGFVLYGADGHLIVCNSKFKEFYGYSDEEASPGVHRRELGVLDIKRNAVIMEEYSEHEYVNRREDLEQGPPKAFVVKLKDGRVLLLSDRKTDSGGIVSIQSDITELKNAEAALSAAKDEALTANRAKSEFLAHMSHELRTPLNSILGFTQVMKEEVFGALGHAKYLDYAMSVNQSGQHLLALINDILDISKIESGEVTLEDAVFDLHETVGACIKMVTGQTGEPETRIAFKTSEDARFFRGDERIVKQIVLNLLSNAMKFTPSDKSIQVTIVLNRDAGIVVEVADRGCGIASDDIEKVLEPFGQVRTGAHQSHAGTGLGLSLSKMLTELHGGALSVKSDLGEGTIVRLSFPLERTVAG